MSAYNWEGLKAQIMSDAAGLLATWFPAGQIHGREFKVGSLQGESGKSLSINIDTGIWADFATGDTGADLIDLFAKSRGLSLKDAYHVIADQLCYESPNITTTDKPKKPRTNKNDIVYNYSDEFFVVRKPNKVFIPHTYIDGAWYKKAPDIRPLYALGDINKKHILITEGEKAAHGAKEIAGSTYTVVTWHGGSNAVKKTDWSKLKGKDSILIWPDNDEPGYKALKQVAAILYEHNKTIKYINVKADSNVPDKWDAADAAEAGMDYSLFKQWAAPLVQVYTPPTPAEVVSKNETETIPRPTHTVAIVNSEDLPEPHAENYFALWNKIGLQVQNNGSPVTNMTNAYKLIDYEFGGKIWEDTFHGKKFYINGSPEPHEITDAFYLRTLFKLQNEYGLRNIKKSHVEDAVDLYASHRQRSEPADWMNSLTWDGKPRIDRFMPDYLDTKDDEYTQAIGKNFWISMVARILEPGCKVDNMIILEGPQGARKSTALDIIGGKWFSETNESVNSKDFYQSLVGSMIVEIAELDSFSRAEVNTVKKMITTRIDRYRRSYGRRAEDFPRQCVFAGTTNDTGYLRDMTGARRFWPVQVGTIDLKALKRDREQLFAEAVHRFKAGESWYKVPESAVQEQAARQVDPDAWTDAVMEYCIGKEYVTIREIAISKQGLCLDYAQMNYATSFRIANILKANGWTNRVMKVHGISTRVYAKGQVDITDYRNRGDLEQRQPPAF